MPLPYRLLSRIESQMLASDASPLLGAALPRYQMFKLLGESVAQAMRVAKAGTLRETRSIVATFGVGKMVLVAH